MASTKTSLWRAVRLAGMVACGQCAAALVPVDVSNPGFEDGTAGWSGGRNMAIDEQVAQYGPDRLVAALNRLKDRPMDEVLPNLRQRVMS